MMIERTRAASICILPLISVLGACAPKDGALPADVTSELENAFTRGDVAGCADVYTDDAEIISENAPVVRSKQAIREFFKDQVVREISFDTDSAVSLMQGDLAFDQGTYRVRNVKLGQDVEYGEYLNVWKRQSGRWRVYRSMYNTTMSRGGGISVAPDEEEAPSAGPPPATGRPSKTPTQ